MIVTVTLNPSIDRTLYCRGFKAGSINTAEILKIAPGGKGINVSRAVQRLSGKTLSLSIIGGVTGRMIVEMMENEEIAFKYVSIIGESRICYGIINGEETIINECGPSIYGDAERQFMELFVNNISINDFIVISGSSICGIIPEFYAKLVQRAKKLTGKDGKVMVDLKGDNLRHAISALPDFVKVNRAEIESYFGHSIHNITDLKNMSTELLQQGICGVIVTDAGNDVFGCTAQQAWIITPPKVKAINTWGSGDCVAGGFAHGLIKHIDFDEALKLGVACGTANTLVYGAGFIEDMDVNRLLDMIVLKNIY
jgi:1-phosphofructokinase family hexose kinase